MTESDGSTADLAAGTVERDGAVVVECGGVVVECGAGAVLDAGAPREASAGGDEPLVATHTSPTTMTTPARATT